MKIAANKVNGSLVVDKNRMYEANDYYVRLYCNSQAKLWDLNYQISQSVFDEYEFFTALIEEYPEVSNLLTSYTTCKMILEPEFLDYVKELITDNELKTVISLYQNILESKRAFKLYTDMDKSLKFRYNQAKLNPLINASGKICSGNRYGLNLDCKEALKAFKLEEGKGIRLCDVRPIFYKQLQEEIGVDEPFTSIKDEYRYIKYFLRNDIEGTTEAGKKLNKYILDYYESHFGTTKLKSSIVSFEEVITLKCLSKCIDKVNEFRKLHPSAEEFYVTSDGVYFKDEEFLEPETSSFVSISDIDIIDGSTKLKLSNRNLQRGYSGVFIPESALVTTEVQPIGFPVELFVNDTDTVTKRYYPAINVSELCETL